MENTALAHHLILAGLLFALGLAGVLVRRNLLVVYMCLELMLVGLRRWCELRSHSSGSWRCGVAYRVPAP